MKSLKIGILGLGTVGGGAYTILTENKKLIEERTGCSIEIGRILDRSKKPGVPEYLFTEDPDDVLNSKDIDLIIETLGGIEPATSFKMCIRDRNIPIHYRTRKAL